MKKHHLEFLELLLSDMTYKEIATKMDKNIYDIMNYRQNLIRQFNVRGRAGLMMVALQLKKNEKIRH